MRTGERHVALAEDVELFCDRLSGDDMIACDHHRLDASLAADGDRGGCLRSRRIDHADQTDESQFIFERFGRRLFGQLVEHAIADRQYAERLAAHLVVGDPRLFEIARDAQLRHHVERALYDRDVFAVHLVNSRHQFAVGIERHFGDARIGGVELDLVVARLCRGEHYRRLGRVADVGLFAALYDDGTVTAERAVIEQFAHVVAQICDVEIGDSAAVDVRLDERHPVLSQCARLVRTYHGRAAQRLDRRQPLDDRVLLDHARDADGQHDRDDRGKSLGDRRDRERDRYHEDLERRDAVDQADDKHDRACGKRDYPKPLAQFGEFLLQRRRLLLFTCEQVGDLAHLRLHARAGDDRGRSAVGDRAPREDHVAAVAYRRLVLDDGIRVLFGRHRLARQRGFFRFEIGAVDEPCVRRDKVARLELDDVARDDLGRRDDRLFAVADDLCVRRGHVFERFERLFRLVFLQHAYHRVHDDDEEDESRLDELHRVFAEARDDERNDRRNDQDDDHHVFELFEKADEKTLLFLFRQLVLAHFGKSLLRLRRAQTL